MMDTRRGTRAAGTAALVLVLLAGCSGSGEDHPAAVQDGSPGTSAAEGPAATVSDARAVVPGRGPDATAAPTPEADPGRVVSAIALPSTLTRGQTATAVFLARPGNSCQLDVRYPNGSAKANQRLSPSTADADGQVAWSWTVSQGAGKGEAVASVVCSGGSRGEAKITVS